MKLNLRKKVISGIVGTAMLGTIISVAAVTNITINNKNNDSVASSYEVPSVESVVSSIPSSSSSASSVISSAESVASSEESQATSSAAPVSSKAPVSSTPAVSSAPAAASSSTPVPAPNTPAPAATPAPDANSTAPNSTASTSSTDNTSARNAAIAAENTRHEKALNDINAQYDPQIKALQDEIAKFQAESAHDNTAELESAQKRYDTAQQAYDWARNYYQPLKSYNNNQYNEAMEPYQLEYDRASQSLASERDISAKYQVVKSDQSKLGLIQSEKVGAIADENLAHTENVYDITIKY